MLKECLEVFAHELQEKTERLILDTYIPADGTYLIVGQDGNIKSSVEIRKDKKTKEIDRNHTDFEDICFFDYHSQLVSMNKPVDGKKVIHSNSYLSFFVKKDSVILKKLTEDIIDGYYGVLANPAEKKYKKSKEACKIYEFFEQNEGAVDIEKVEKNKQWIKKHIFQLENIDMERKEYLKIFFEADREAFEKEDRRYLLPNIYNSNDYNLEICGNVYGLPDNNLGMNAKKPFLSNKTRKIAVPYLLNGDDVLLQKQFFDYLMNLASAGKNNIYIDTQKKKIIPCKNGQVPDKVGSGYYLRIKKGKELEIQNQDNIPGYDKRLNTAFQFRNVLKREHNKHPEYHDRYQQYYERTEMGQVVNEVFFSKYLASNFYTETSEISIKDEKLKNCILMSREVIFNWVYKGIDLGFRNILDKVSLELIKGTLLNGYKERALWQLNLRWSLEEYFSQGGKNMTEDIMNMMESVKSKVLSDRTVLPENDDEYYYAVGQLVSFLISLNKARDKNQSLINPFMNARTDEVIKKRMIHLYKKYNYRISHNSKRAKNLLAMVEGYVPTGKVNQEKIMFGYASDNIIYTNVKEEKANE